MLRRFVPRCRELAARILRALAWRIDRVATIAQPSLPAWVDTELRALAHIEPDLLTPEGTTSKYQYYSVPSLPAPGEAYAQLLDAIGDAKPSHVILVPWLKQGGADRGALYHARALAAQTRPGEVLVVTTEPADSPWRFRLPEGVGFVELGHITRGLDFNFQTQVPTRFLVQLQPRLVHIINSRCGWEAVRRSGLAISQSSSLFASLFCDEYRPDGTPVGYARDYLRQCFDKFETIFCDNSRYPEIWSRDLGIPHEVFTFLPFPYDGDLSNVPTVAISRPGSNRILWAGRLDRQKRPDVLAKIAARMPDVEFDVYGISVTSATVDASVTALGQVRNITLHGEFQRLEEVATPDHFAYLHTTAWEGTPTILFDVAAAGLPICAPAVGGIVDFLGSEDLIEDAEDIDAFVARLRRLRESSDARDAVVRRQRDSLTAHRAWPDFIRNLQGAGSYLCPQG